MERYEERVNYRGRVNRYFCLKNGFLGVKLKHKYGVIEINLGGLP